MLSFLRRSLISYTDPIDHSSKFFFTGLVLMLSPLVTVRLLSPYVILSLIIIGLLFAVAGLLFVGADAP